MLNIIEKKQAVEKRVRRLFGKIYSHLKATSEYEILPSNVGLKDTLAAQIDRYNEMLY